MSIILSDASSVGGDEAGLLTRVRRRKGLFLTVFICVAGIVAAVYLVTPPTYVAVGTVMVTAYSSDVAGGGMSPAAEQKLGDPADMDSQLIVAQSPRLLKDMLLQLSVRQALYDDCNLARRLSPMRTLRATFSPPQSCETELAGDQALDWLTPRLSVGAAGRSRVIQLSYHSRSPKVAATIVNSLIDAYLTQGTADKQRARIRAAAWIQGERDRIGADLRHYEVEIENFRRDHGLVRGQTASIASERLSQVSQQLAAAEAAWSDARARIEQLRNGAGDARETLESRTIGDLKQKLAEVSSNIASVASSHGQGHPELAALEQQKADLQRRITEETGHIRSSLDRDYASATVQVEALREQVDELKRNVGSGDLAETQIASMVRDNDVRRELYVDLSKKANDLEAQLRLVTGDVRLVSGAQVPDKIASPKPVLFVAAGVLMATVLAIAAALVRDRSDASVRNSGQLESLTGSRVLGRIPHLRRLRGGYARSIAAQVGQPSALQEAVRSLYIKCVLLSAPTRPRALLIASANSGEGKSFLTLTMAQFGAAAGQRVLAIEADLRRPGFRLALGLADGPGLADVLRGTAAFGQTVRKTGLGFDVVPAGAPTVASTELLSNGRIADFLKWARGHYDLVLIDSPPAQLLMDAHVLASRVDGVLYCVRWGGPSLDVVAESALSLRHAGGEMIGLVLGMVKPREYRLYEPTKLLSTPYLMALG